LWVFFGSRKRKEACMMLPNSSRNNRDTLCIRTLDTYNHIYNHKTQLGVIEPCVLTCQYTLLMYVYHESDP
jgi:hypothetical protein